MKDRYIRNFKKLKVETWMSGMGCVELLIFLQWFFLNRVIEVDPPKIGSACDFALNQEVVLTSFDNPHGPGCVFGPIESLLPEDLALTLEPLKPGNTASVQEKREAYAAIQRELRLYFDRNPDILLKGPCLIHGGDREMCHVYPQEQKNRKGLRKDPQASDSDSEEELFLSVAGVDCTDTTRNGFQKGSGGASRFSHIVWGAIQRHLRRGLVCGECTEDWLPIDVADELDGYDNERSCVSAFDSGDPYNRRRSMFSGCKGGTVC